MPYGIPKKAAAVMRALTIGPIRAPFLTRSSKIWVVEGVSCMFTCFVHLLKYAAGLMSLTVCGDRFLVDVCSSRFPVALHWEDTELPSVLLARDLCLHVRWPFLYFSA